MSNIITLSSYSSKDREWLKELLIDTKVREFLPHLTTDVDIFRNDMEIAEQKGLGRFWIIRLYDVGIGFITIYDLTEEPFIFYAMSSEFRNKGYMKKALRMIENEYFSILSTIVDANNVQSFRILRNTKINVNTNSYE